jgi:hypothetical protein
MKRAFGVLGIAAASLLFATASPDTFRFSRPLKASPGWARLALPDDVLDACRPGLPDLRLFGGESEEVPWALEERIARALVRLAFRDVERASNRETTAILDRGAHPGLARSATLEVDGEDYLKPVTIESSDDGVAWKAFAQGSVFSTRRARSTTLRFAPNDRRWWRFRFDDRNGEPVAPRAALLDSESDPTAVREVPLTLGPATGESPLTATLPAANLGVFALRIEAVGAAYARRVRIWERIFFRGEVLRRPIGEAALVRAADGSGRQEVPLCDSSARVFEIEVERMDGPLLEISRVVALARPRAIVFTAPAAGGLALRYGSAAAEAPRYDLERALALAKPRDPATATVGPPETGATAAATFPPPARGAALDPVSWKWRQPIELPAAGNVAYLDLTGSAAHGEGSPRILDAANRQVPYVVERAAHRERHPVASRVHAHGTKTIIELLGVSDPTAVDMIEISATAPEYFSRALIVLEQLTDARGEAESRILGSTSWEKRAEEAFTPIAISISRPSGSAVRIEIENGDNAPLLPGAAAVWTSVPRIDFAFDRAEQLILVSGNPEAAPPRYDLELVAARVLEAPALPARLKGAPVSSAPKSPGAPGWLWIAVVAAGVLVTVVLARTLRPGG